MRMRDCVMLASFLTNQTEEYEALGGNGSFVGEVATGVQRNIDNLIRCGNLVVSEIASAYLLLKKRESVATSEDGCVYYADLEQIPTFIFDVRKDGRLAKYKEFPDRIEVSASGRVEIIYAYLPPILSLDDELPFVSAICERTVAYGIAAEYYLVSGQSDEAIVWDKRYRDSLHNAMLKRGEIKLKPRRWIGG